MAENFMASVGMVIALLIAVIVGLMIYWNVANVSDLKQVTDTFACVNTSNLVTSLSYLPHSSNSADLTATYYNTSAATWKTLGTGIHGYVLSGTTVTVYTTWLLNISQAKFVYYSNAGVVMRDAVNPTSSTVLTLAPLIAIVLIAGIILAVVVGFGKGQGV